MDTKSKKMSKEEFITQVMDLDRSADEATAELASQLHHYEEKYNMRSEVFYRFIVGTPAEDNPDFIAWAICYRSYFRALRSKLSVQGVVPDVV